MTDDLRVQYATTQDGVRIAYSVTGSGPPIMHLPGYPFNHLRGQLEISSLAAFYRRIASAATLIRFDHRGTGMSQRDRLATSREELVVDMEAVLNKLNLHPITLSGWGYGTVAVADYALRNPENVSRLILWDTPLEPPAADDRIRVLIDLAERDWDLFINAAVQGIYGWEQGAEAEAMANYLRACTAPEALRLMMEDSELIDATRLTWPILVLKHDEAIWPPPDRVTEIVAQLPNASLVTLDGRWITTVERGEHAADIILDFMQAAGVGPTPPTANATPPTAFRTVLFTDLVGHTEMMSRLGDERGRAVLREHERITREVLKAHSGTEVKTMGDGFMASFGSVTRAVECAIALQRAIDERNQSVGASHPRSETTSRQRDEVPRGDDDPMSVDDSPLRTPVEPISVRVGLNAGEPIEEEGDLFGATVILASRIAAKAEGGEILVADTVRGLCSGKGFLFADRGEFVAKGFEEPVRMYEVRWRE